MHLYVFQLIMFSVNDVNEWKTVELEYLKIKKKPDAGAAYVFS